MVLASLDHSPQAVHELPMPAKDVERGLIARYAARVLQRGDLPSRGARHVVWWLYERMDVMGFMIPQPLVDVLAQPYGSAIRMGDFEAAFSRTRNSVVREFDEIAKASPTPQPLASNVESMILALDIENPDVAWKIVGLIACCSRYEQVQYFANAVQEAAGPITRAISLLVGETTGVVEACLSPSAELIGSGLLQIGDGDYLGGHGAKYIVPYRINSRLDRTYADFADMRNALIGDPLISGVSAGDYEHVEADRDLIINVLEGTAKAQAAGVNILLYGPPGSGKTELAKVAAQAAGLSLMATGEENQQGTEADRSGRLSDLVFSQRLLAGERNTALLFDELEDVAVHLIRRGGSKVYLNRLLETNPLPVIWTSNELGHIDPAILRRMTLAIELKRPPAAQRRRIMEQLLKRNGVEIPDEELDRLAQHLDATPAILENAIRAARFAGGGAETIERAARGIMRAVTGVGARRAVAIPAFDPALTTASRDLIGLGDQLVAGEARAFSLCLYGPPGTGKSAFARYLAGRLGLQIMQIRASDILGMYVGQSERNIAAAFEEAREASALLVFDEADSLLWDRRDAQRSWEASQVNEMLTWMEEHPLPVCFTTNLMDRIDQASLRRFTFAVQFGYLDRSALERAWHVFFGLDPAPASGLTFTNLAPGDFAKARKQAEVLGILGRTAEIVDLVAEISRTKPGTSGSLGFMGG
jgi:SpoVK/Ycf46/Vps4 family AAA+-type ATPase